MTAARVTAARRPDGSITVEIATGSRPWRFRLSESDAEQLERALAAARQATAPATAARRGGAAARRSR